MTKSNPAAISPEEEDFLKVRPSIKSDKKVRINIHAEVSTFAPEIFEDDEFSFERGVESFEKDRVSSKKTERKHVTSPERNNFLSVVNENEVSHS